MKFNTLGLALVGLAAAQFPRWDRIPSSNARIVARSGHSTIANDTHVMIFGGETSDGTYPELSIAYNLATREVSDQPIPTTQGGPFKVNRAAFAQVSPGSGMVFGGRDPLNEGGAYSFGTWSYDSNTNVLRPVAVSGTQASPPGREFASGAWMPKCYLNTTTDVVEPCFAFFGGLRGTTGSPSQVWQAIPRGADAVQWRVQSIPGSPTPRWSTMAGVSPAGDVLYLIGGDTAGGATNQVWAYAPFGFPDLRAGEYDNIARTGVADHSSEWNALVNGAFRAIDGGISGVFSNNQCTHTNTAPVNMTQPWFVLDLRSVQAIDNLRIYQRTDCCRGRNAGYRIFVGNTRSALNWADPNNVEIRPPASDILGSYDDVPSIAGVRARYIWIMLPGTNRVLTLCEVEVWQRRPDVWRQLSGVYNAALNKPAFMSSKDNNAEENQLGGDANQCTDGNTGGNAPDWCKTSTVTWNGAAALTPRVFFYVDLGFAHDVGSVRIFPRIDSPNRPGRSTRLEVYVGNSRMFEGCARCAGPFNNVATIFTGQSHLVQCPMMGRYVHVRRVPAIGTAGDENTLELAEVQVNANRLTNQPAARSGASYASYGGFLVMFGGRDQTGVQLNDVRLFDLVDGVWLPPTTVFGTPPLARAFGTLTALPNVMPGSISLASPGNQLLLFGGVGPESALGDLTTLSFAPCPRLTDPSFATLTCSHMDTVCYYTCFQGAAAHANGGRPLRCGLDGAWIGIAPYCIDFARVPPNVGQVTILPGANNATVLFKAVVPGAGLLPVTKYKVQARTNAYVQQFTSNGFMDSTDWSLFTPHRQVSHVYGFKERSLFMNLENGQDCWGGSQFCMILTRPVPSSVVPTVESNWAVETYVEFETSNTFVPLDGNQFGLTLFDANETRWTPFNTSFRGQSEIFAGIRRAGGTYQVGWEQTGSRWSYWVGSGGRTFAWIRLERMWDADVNRRQWRFGYKFDNRDQWVFTFPRYENTLDRGPGNSDVEFLPAQHLRVGLMGKNGQGLRIRAFATFGYFRIAPVECTDTGVEVEAPQPTGATTNTDITVTIPGLDGGMPYLFAVKAYNGLFWSNRDSIAPTQPVGQPAVYTRLPLVSVPPYNLSNLVQVSSGRNRPWSQSSFIPNNQANLAFDGNLFTQCHTLTGNSGEWIQVDLGIQTSVKAMRLHNRPPDGPCPFCPDRLNGFQVFVSPTSSFTDAPTCKGTPFNITSAENFASFFWSSTLNVLRVNAASGQRNYDPALDFTAEWACPLVGRYVTVRVPPNQGIGGRDGFVHIRELLVFAGNSCPPRPAHPLADIVPGTVCSSAVLGSVCAHRCKPGYVPVAGSSTSTCDGEGWDEPTLVCAPECPSLPEPAFSATCMRSIFAEDFNSVSLYRNDSVALANAQANSAARWRSLFPVSQAFGDKWFVLPAGDTGAGYLAGAASQGCDDELYAAVADVKVTGHREAFELSAVVATPNVAGLFFRAIDRQNMYRVSIDVVTSTVTLVAIIAVQVTRLNDIRWNPQILQPYNPVKLTVTMEGPTITVFVNDVYAFDSNILDRTLLAGSAGVYAATNATFDDVRFNVPCVGSVTGATNADVATFTCQAGLYAEGPLTRTCRINANGRTADWVPSTAQVTSCRLAPPVMISQTLFVNENSARNALVGSPIQASVDSPDYKLQFKIDDCFPRSACTAGGPFTVDVCSGQVKVRNAMLDFETTPAYILTIRCYVAEFATTFAMLNYTVRIINVNEPPMVYADTFTLVENAVGGAMVGTVSVWDPEGDAVTTTIQLVSPGGVFYTLDSATRAITVLPGTVSGDLNFENPLTQTVTMVVLAREVGNPDLLGTAEMTILLNDTNDAPVLTANQVVFFDEAQSASGTRGTSGADAAVAVTAADEDAGQTPTLVFSLPTPATSAQAAVCNISGTSHATTDGTATSAALFSISSAGVLSIINVPTTLSRWSDLASGGKDPYASLGALLWADYGVCVQVTDPLGAVGYRVVQVGIVALPQSLPVIRETTTPLNLNTAGGETVILTGTGFDAPGAVRSFYANIDNPRINYTAPCVVMSATTINCTTVPGVGVSYTWSVFFGTRRAADVAPVVFSYGAPFVSSIIGHTNMATTGSSGMTSIDFSGGNFGPPGTVVRVVYGPSSNPSRFTCTPVSIPATSNTLVRCLPPPGAGENLGWTITVGGQTATSGTDSSLFINYAAPAISRVVNGTAAVDINALGTRGGQEITIMGSNFGPSDIPVVASYGGPNGNVLTFADCRKPGGEAAHTTVTCRTLPGVGKEHKVSVSVEGVPSLARWPSSPGGLAYRIPNIDGVSGAGINNMDTAGGTVINLHGDGFGPATWQNIDRGFITVTYGKAGDVTRYVASGCAIVTDGAASKDTIACNSAPGVGKDHMIALTVSGQSAQAFAANLAYAAPQIFFFSGPGASDADTRGNQDTVVTGRNFGPADAYTESLLNISYGVEVRNGPGTLSALRFIPPTACRITTSHTEITCKTAEGAGAEHTWKVYVDGVESKSPSTSYHEPVINDIVDAQTLQPVTAANAANVDGGDVVLVRGDFFGPLAYSATGLPLIQSVSFGSTGTEYALPASNWQLVSPGHAVIRVTLPPGAGSNLRFRISVADQQSAASTSVFSYSRIAVEELMPNTASTFSDPSKPTIVTVRARNVPVRDPLSRIELIFGNAPFSQRLSVVVPQGPAAILAATNADKSMNLTFALPRDGGGVDLAVRLDVVSASSPVGSPPVVSSLNHMGSLFSYKAPVITDVILTASRFKAANATDADVDAIDCPFPSGNAAWRCDDPSVYQLTLLGDNFGGDPATLLRPDGLSKKLELLIFDDGITVLWSVDRLWIPARGYGHNRILAYTLRQTGLVRLSLTSTAFNGTTVVQTVSVEYRELSPQIGAIVGDLTNIPTVGGSMITIDAFNLNNADDVAVLIGGKTAALFEDLAGTRPLTTPAARQAYIAARTTAVASAATKNYPLFARVPAGQGKDVSVIVMRTKAGKIESSNTGFRIAYSPPSVNGMRLLLAPGYSTELAPNLDGITSLGNARFTVVAPTDGSARLRVRGTNLGEAPTVLVGDGFTMPSTPCPGAEGTEHKCVDVMIPAGEGAGGQFPEDYGEFGYRVQLIAGDQLAAFYPFRYGEPVVTSIRAAAFPTQGGVPIELVGTNFGERRAGRPDTVLAIVFNDATGGAPLVCTNIVRVSHFSMNCTLPEGSGRNLDAFVTVADLPAAASRGMLTYDRPVVTSATILSGVTRALPGFTHPVLLGNTTGGDLVELTGANFGVKDSVNCAFLAWVNRAPGGVLACDLVEGFLGEGEVDMTYVVEWNHTNVKFLVPPGLGYKEVQLSIRGSTLAGSAADPSAFLFRYLRPRLDTILPRQVDTEGGVVVEVVGENLGPMPRNFSRADLRLLSETFLPATRIPLSQAPSLPSAYLVITFHRGCVSMARDVRGFKYETSLSVWYGSPRVDSCDSEGIISIGQRGVQFVSPAGIGKDRDVYVHVVDPVDGIIESSDPIKVSYFAPEIQSFSPSVVYMSGEVSSIDILGRYFGNEDKAVAQGWSGEELAKSGAVGGFECTNVRRVRENGETLLSCLINQVALPAGYRNVTVRVAGQVGVKDATPSGRTLLLVCAPGFYGRVNETCLPCPADSEDPALRGAICRGYIPQVEKYEERFTYPRPLKGFYNLNSSDVYTRRVEGAPSMMPACPAGFQDKGRDVCIVACDPPESCLGDNLCAEGYTSKPPMWRCASCDKGFYKRAGECVKCPDSPGALFIGFILLVMFVATVGFFLNKKQVNIAVISIGVDFFQVLAIFAQARVKWPPIVKELLHVLSAFNLNIEIVAPECLIPDVSYKQKFWFIMVLPLAIGSLFGVSYFALAAYKMLILGRPKKQVWNHHPTLVSSGLVLIYLLYLYLTRTILDVFNCGPTFPPDGKNYLQVVFEECGIPGGTQLTLLPFAVAGLAVYTAGYPLFIGYTLFKNREIVMEDQLLRAKGTGLDKLTNPRAFDFRQTFGRSYFQFKPDFCMWILAIVLRKFFIAITAVVFGKNSSFQMAACLLIMFLSYAAQVQIRPYMSPGDFEEVLRTHQEMSYSSAVHARLRASLAGIESRGRKKGHKNLINFEGKVDRAAVFGVLTGFFFNYNTVEAIMTFCAVIVCLMAIMYQANEVNSYYPESKDSVTTVTLIIIIWAIVYFFTVFVTEIVVLYNEDTRAKQLAKAARSRADKPRKGSDADDAVATRKARSDSEVQVGNVQSTSNPMFLKMSQDGETAVTSGTGTDSAVQALLQMQEAPPVELWRVFQQTFADMSTQLKSSQSQVADLKKSLQSGGERAADEALDAPTAAAKKKREFAPQDVQSAQRNPLKGTAAASSRLSLSAARKSVAAARTAGDADEA